MKKYLYLIVIILSFVFIGNSTFWSSICDSRKNWDTKAYKDCLNTERYNQEIDNYNSALQRQDHVQAIAALERAKKYKGTNSDINNRIQQHAAYLCSAYAWKEDYSTALVYCKKSLAIYEDASVLYNAWFVSAMLEDWDNALNYLNKSKKKSLDQNLNSQIDNLIAYVKQGKEYANLKKTWKTNDKYWYYQYYMQKINIFDAWDKLPASKHKVVIAVIDEGVNINHPDFKDRIWTNKNEIPGDWIDNDDNGYVDDYNWWDFVQKSNYTIPAGSHGTMVAGIIAANTDNMIGIAWIVPDVEIMPLKVFWFEKESSEEYIIDAINYAIDNGADIINLSLEWSQFGYNNNYDAIFKKANKKWIIIVVAAWNWDVLSAYNEWINTTINKKSPVCNEENEKVIIWVWSLTKKWAQSKWSNYGSCVDFYMYWEEIYTTAINLDWEPYLRGNWTSFSAPIVAWIIWLWYNKFWKVGPNIVYDNLKKSLNWNVIDASKYLDNLSATFWELKIAISRLSARWFTNAKNADEFKFSNWITRAEASKFFVMYANLFHKNKIVNDDTKCKFSDLGNAPSDLRSYVINACRYGLLSWKNWKFMPNDKLTNAQAVTVFMRMYGWKKDESWKHFADKYFVDAYKLWLIDWMIMWKQKNYEEGATRWDMAILLYRWVKLMEK